MLQANWHTYQVLTKRSGRMRELLETSLRDAAAAPQIWWGVSVENRRDGLPRIRDLRKSPAVTRFLSVEPLLEDLGPLDLTGIHWVIVGGESGAGFRPVMVIGSRQFATSAGKPGCRFSSNSGVASTRQKPAGRSTGRPTMKSPTDAAAS